MKDTAWLGCFLVLLPALLGGCMARLQAGYAQPIPDSGAHRGFAAGGQLGVLVDEGPGYDAFVMSRAQGKWSEDGAQGRLGLEATGVFKVLPQVLHAVASAGYSLGVLGSYFHAEGIEHGPYVELGVLLVTNAQGGDGLTLSVLVEAQSSAWAHTTTTFSLGWQFCWEPFSLFFKP